LTGRRRLRKLGVPLTTPTPPRLAPRLLVLGHVTRDEAGGKTRLGGAASYAAQAAARLGVETALVTVAPAGDPLLAPLRSERRIALHCADSDVMTTFALDYVGARRTLALRRRARSLAPDDVPAALHGAPVAYVGPRFVGAGLQGWLRRARPDGEIEPALSPEARHPPPIQVAVVSEQDHPDVDRIAARFVAAGPGIIVAITRGARGATLLTRSGTIDIPAAPAREVDPTGAGDVFGVVLTLHLAAGALPAHAAAAAAQAAAHLVEAPRR
jgi:1D-myo-inositol 3-kinase